MKRLLVSQTMLWSLLTLAAGAYFAIALFTEGAAKTPFLPGETTHGHYQIELSCGACHQSSFADKEDIQAACVRCHEEELTAANDSHPRAKFTDPRNADRVEILDARYCVTCHAEHKPEVTHTMGLSLPEDYCYHCHQDVAEERPSHEGMGFDTCAEAGCHNFHDNRALYEDFLEKHLDEPKIRLPSLVPALPEPAPVGPRLVRADADGPETTKLADAEFAAWLGSSHARAGVNCTGCHSAPGNAAMWSESVAVDVCESCHSKESETWQRGRHGMRVGSGLSPMEVSAARLPMRQEVSHQQLGCNSCHKSHGYDTKQAAVEGCLQCHNDGHSQGYKQSVHATLWQKELSGDGPERSGVTCATCHMPRIRDEATNRWFVQHNQNDNLRPNEKMIRSVCINCHGVGFAINALSDRELIGMNFQGLPRVHVESLDLVKNKLQLLNQTKGKKSP